MNDPRSSRWREVDAKRDRPTPSDLGICRMTEWKDLEEVSRGEHGIPLTPNTQHLFVFLPKNSVKYFVVSQISITFAEL